MSGVRLHLTRDRVAAGDDVFAPHEKTMTAPGSIATPADLQDAVARIAPDYLPNVAGRATWAAYCGIPLAVFSNRGTRPQPFFLFDFEGERFDRDLGGFRIQFIYFSERDPDVVFDILEQTRRVQPSRVT